MTLTPGTRWHNEYGTVRIMAVVEGYVMFRHPHCTPLVKSVKEFQETYKPGTFAEALSKALKGKP